MSYTPKYLLFISRTDKEMLSDDLLEEIDQLYHKSLKAFEENNIEENAACLRSIWNKLLEDKSQLSVSYHIARELAEDFMMIKDYQEAMKWAMETFNCSANRYDYGERELLVGKVAYESGDMEKAKAYLTLADKKSQGKIFDEGDVKYLRFIRNHIRESDSLKMKKVINIYKEAKQFTEEELEQISEIAIGSEVTEIVNKAEDLMEKKEYKKAVKLYKKAFKALQYPVQDFLNELRIQEGMGEAYFHLGAYKKTIDILSKIWVTPYGEETDNPYVLLRLGQSLIESGASEQGLEFLLKAYTVGGLEIFNHEDPKYFNFIKREDEIAE